MSVHNLEHRGVLNAIILPGTPQAITGNGAASIDKYKTDLTTGAGAAAVSLANGRYDGQLKLIQMVVDGGGDATVTPDSLADGSTITFADAGDSALLAWNNGAWFVVDLFNRADGASAPVVA